MLLNQYVPDGVKRCAAPEFDDSARFTTMLGGTAAGNMLASFNIVKCTIDRPDLRSSTVIKTLHEKYTAADGWALKTWEHELTLKVNGVDKTQHYFRPYIVIVRTDGTVITMQHEAWVDSVGMCMWIDLVLGPWARRSGSHLGQLRPPQGRRRDRRLRRVGHRHGEPAAQHDGRAAGDGSRRQRATQGAHAPLSLRRLVPLLSELEAQVGAGALKPAGSRVMPAFSPPKPALIDGLNMLRSVLGDVFSKDDFKAGLRSAFVKVGLAELDSGRFVNYASHSRGSMPGILAPADSPPKEEFMLGNVAVELELEPRRVNLSGAFEAVAGGPADESDCMDEPGSGAT